MEDRVARCLAVPLGEERLDVRPRPEEAFAQLVAGQGEDLGQPLELREAVDQGPERVDVRRSGGPDRQLASDDASSPSVRTAEYTTTPTSQAA